MDRRIGLRRCGLVESLECRTFLDASVSGVPAGDVVITGTDGDDVIEVSGGAGGTVIVVNGVTTTGPSTV